MMIKVSTAVVVALLVGFVGSAPAQDAPKPEVAKGVSSRGLVTSLGGFSATVNAPVFVTGATVEIQPGGQTGRQQFRVPTFIYVLDGTVRCSLPESTERLTPGSTLVISEGCPHSLGTDEGAAWLEIKSPPQATWH